MTDRIEAIEEMLRKDPDDVFLRYSLGMEYAGAGRHAEAAEAFGRCIELDESYLAAYVERGKSLRAAGDLPGARAVFQRALALAEAKGETHTRDYIRQQMEGLGGSRS